MNFYSTMSHRSMGRSGYRFQGTMRPQPNDRELRSSEAVARATFGIPPTRAIVFTELNGWAGRLVHDWLRVPPFLLVWVR